MENLIKMEMFFTKAAKNSVEVYIRNGGTKSRCSQYCGGSMKDEETSHMTLHQLQGGSQESTLLKNDSTRIHPPNLRR